MPKRTSTLKAQFKKLVTVGNITEYTFQKNGMRILNVRADACPTVTTCIVYGVGSQHEGKGETGLAHMLEHMLFKETGTQGPTWKKLEEKGAVLNATTWLDRTLYYFNLPKQYLGDMLAVEADRMRNVKLTKKEFEPERTNVLSEYEMHNSEAESALEWNIVASAFQSHGYKHDTIGFRTDIENYTTLKLQNFYNKFYWPNNATLIVVGDIGKMELFESVAQHFGHIPPNFDSKLHETTREMKQEGVRRVVLERETPIRAVHIAFKAPPFTSREWTALYLAILHLTDGKTSVLYKKLVDTHLATAVGGSLYPTKDPFLAEFSVTATEKSSYTKIEHVVRTEIDFLKKHPIPAKRLKELKTYAHAEELFSRDGTLRIASQLAEYVATGDWTRYETELTELKQITAKEIMQAIATYLTLPQSTVGTIEKPSL